MPTGNSGFSIQHKRRSNVNTSVPKCNFEGNLVIMCLATVCFWQFRDLKCDCWTSWRLLCEFNYFVCVEIRILVQKWYMYEAHIFPRSL